MLACTCECVPLTCGPTDLKTGVPSREPRVRRARGKARVNPTPAANAKDRVRPMLPLASDSLLALSLGEHSEAYCPCEVAETEPSTAHIDASGVPPNVPFGSVPKTCQTPSPRIAT